MHKAHYIIFHPDNQRSNIRVSATALVNNILLKKWTGEVLVDKIYDGNEDPFVFNNPWLYSFCHASQLRRQPRNDIYLQNGSWLLFVSGQNANKGFLTFDTIFLIGSTQKWATNPLRLPTKYQNLYNSNQAELWNRHFKFPFLGYHPSVTHTYEAELWEEGKSMYSFLPLDKVDQPVTIYFSELKTTLPTKIIKNIKGKYPVLLSQTEINSILKLVENKIKTKVIKNISFDINMANIKKGNKNHKSTCH